MNNENAIQQALPWAEIKIIGQGIRTPSMMQAAKAEGFTGMFGHCPYQIGTDSITDYGMPWGSFPNSVEEIHRPTHAGEDSLIALEWVHRDLNRSFHTSQAEVWSFDATDVERGGICTDTDVEYWKLAFQEYIRALPLNFERNLVSISKRGPRTNMGRDLQTNDPKHE